MKPSPSRCMGRKKDDVMNETTLSPYDQAVLSVRQDTQH